jgi:hypothetical protein
MHLSGHSLRGVLAQHALYSVYSRYSLYCMHLGGHSLFGVFGPHQQQFALLLFSEREVCFCRVPRESVHELCSVFVLSYE